MDLLANPMAIVFGAIGGGIGLYTTAMALGFRHGIDWDHIAAITDITSATATTTEKDEKESWLLGEPGLQLTDESHHIDHAHERELSEHDHAHVHSLPHEHEEALVAVVAAAADVGHDHDHPHEHHDSDSAVSIGPVQLPRDQLASFWLGTLYALGHGSVVAVLGVLAILAAEVLPDWVDPIMERVVGVTLLFLSIYLFFSLYQYFRGGGEFRIRSRWMLVFAGVGNAWHWLRSRFGEHEHHHVMPQQYSARTAFGIGMIHGVGAETGTQALIIATAVGATNKATALSALLFFVVGLLLSNSVVTLTTTVGFVSARKRQIVYVFAGFIAAVFSLIVGLFFLLQSADILPDLDKYVRWIGGPK